MTPSIDLTTPQGLLTALLFPVWFVMWFASHVINTSDWWVALDPRRQTVILMVASAIIALLAYAAIQLIPASALTGAQPIYTILYNIVVAFIGGLVGNYTGLKSTVARTKLLAEHHEAKLRVRALTASLKSPAA